MDRPLASGPRQLRHRPRGLPRTLRIRLAARRRRFSAADAVRRQRRPACRSVRKPAHRLNFKPAAAAGGPRHMTSAQYNPWVHRLAVLTACAALLPIVMGALVTTTDAGMAFRDWPTSDGHG